ncbi:hypothetical protein Zmor_024042 [Zophobas morio]|uniref:HAT C-terminal dimerisation domain-containing protein n=1 Tax=Zophobas morio TaxID=2755281 RepID=A0AA38I4D5_9CUCU|nr:hypothetical protein Zmor_024042 [Zophobas morio]
MASQNKKRKYNDENRKFKQEWEEEYAFIERNGKALCLICNSSVNNFKSGNLKRHYEHLHSQFSSQFPYKSELRTKKLNSLRSTVNNQIMFMAKFNEEAGAQVEASFKIAWNISRAKRPYTEGDFIKQNMLDVITTLDPNNSKLLKSVSEIPTSRHTIERRISEINKDLELKLEKDLRECVAFSLALDESTDITDQPQLAIFIRFVFEDASCHEELLDLKVLKDTTRGVDIKEALDDALKVRNVPINKLVSVATDGAPAMTGKNVGLIGLLTKDEVIPDFIPVHCIVHREHLVAKYFNFEHIFKIVLKIVNFIRTNAKNHRQFVNFINEIDVEEQPSDLSLYCIVRWLSTYSVLNKLVALLEPISEFLKTKNQSYPQLEDDEWVQDLMFFTDTMEHLQSLNISLQGKNKNISEFVQNIFAFQKKLQLFQKDVTSKTFNHFPRLKEAVSKSAIRLEVTQNYGMKLSNLFHDFKERFSDLEKMKPTIAFLLNPFEVDVINKGFPLSKNILKETAAGELELIDLQEDEGLKIFHKTTKSINEFWKHVPAMKYGHLRNAACRILSIFGSTYDIEALYSTMKFIKSKYRSRLTNQHLKELIRSAVTNYQPNYKELVANVQIHKASTSHDE